MSLLMIGCGKMGGALLAGWLKAGLKGATIIDPGLRDAPQGTNLFKGADEIEGEQYDHIIIAVKPQMVEAILPRYQGVLAPGGAYLSILAGTSLKKLKALTKAPTLRAMPNLPALIGKGITALCEDGASPTHLEQFEKLFSANGPVIRVATEADIDRFTAVAGSGPAYIFEFLRQYIGAAEKIGFSPDIARTLVLQTLLGSAELALSSSEDLETLRRNVTSKGGTTEAGLKALMADDLIAKRLDDTVEAAFKRAQELAD